MKRKQCKPGQHNFVWDEEENKNRIDGGNYHKCTKCGDLAGSPDAYESWSQEIERIEEEAEKFFEELLNKIQ